MRGKISASYNAVNLQLNDLHTDTHRWVAGETQEAEGREPGQERVAGMFH